MKIVAVASVRREAEFTQPHEEKFALLSLVHSPIWMGWIFKASQLSQCLLAWAEKNTKAIMSVKSTGAEEFLEFTVCPAYEHAYSDSGLEVLSVCSSNYPLLITSLG